MSADAYSAQLSVRKREGGPTHASYNGVHLSYCTSTVKYHTPTEALYTGLLLGVHQRHVVQEFMNGPGIAYVRL